MNEYHPITGRLSPYHSSPLFVEAHAAGMSLPDRLGRPLFPRRLYAMTQEASCLS
jgi:hypothetical protein